MTGGGPAEYVIETQPNNSWDFVTKRQCFVITLIFFSRIICEMGLAVVDIINIVDFTVDI